MNQHQGPVQAVLGGANLTLRRSLQAADASPFLGHHALDPGQDKRVADAVRSIARGDAERFLDFFERFPLLCAWLMVAGLAEDYAQDGTPNVYHPIARKFDGTEIPVHVRGPLNQAFRRACIRAGLVLPPRSKGEPADYVRDYIVQAGVAHKQLEALADAFHRAYATLGPAPLDDTRRLHHWSCEAAEFVHPGLSRLRRVIHSDGVGYHALIFSRLRDRKAAVSPFEQQFLKAILETAERNRNAGTATERREPNLTFNDGELAVENVARSQAVLLLIEGRERFLSSGARYDLSAPWPDSIAWRFIDNEEPENFLSLPVIAGDDILVFESNSGTLVRRLLQDARAVALETPEVVLVSREPFHVDGTASYNLGGRHALFAVLDNPITVVVGSRSIRLSLVERPRLVIEGEIIASAFGSPLIVAPSGVRVFADADTLKEALIVRVEHPALAGSLDVPVERRPDGTLFAGLDGLPDEGAFGALRLSLSLKSQQRAIARTRAWLWPGLRGLVEGMAFDGALPANFAPELSAHLEIAASGRLELASGSDYLQAVLTFRLTDGECVAFSFPRPGLVISIAPPSGPEQSIAVGSIVTIADNLDGSLVIRSSDRRAALEVRGRHEAEPFANSGVRRISLASLLVSDGSDEVRYSPKGDPHLSFTLISIAPATSPERFALSQRSDVIEIKSRFRIPVDAARLILTHTVRGEILTLEAGVGRRPVACPPDEGFSAAQSGADRRDLTLCLNRNTFFGGVWIADISVREEGGDAWHPVVNQRLDEFSFAFTGCGARRLLRDNPATVFLRLNAALSRCYAPETWPSIARILVPEWRALGEAVTALEAGHEVLMKAAGQAHPALGSPSWIPIHHPLEIDPDLFGAPRQAFQAFVGVSAEGGEHLAHVAKLAQCARIRDARTVLNIGNPFFLGFENFTEAERRAGVALRDFQFERFVQVGQMLESDTSGTFWNPTRDWLTISHHSWCCARALERVQRAAPPGSNTNQTRLPGATRFATAARMTPGVQALSAPASTSEEMTLVGLMPFALSAFAKACRNCDSRAFLSAVAARTGQPVDEVILSAAFLIRLAPELFAFYLILWDLIKTSESR